MEGLYNVCGNRRYVQENWNKVIYTFTIACPKIVAESGVAGGMIIRVVSYTSVAPLGIVACFMGSAQTQTHATFIDIYITLKHSKQAIII